MSRRLDLALVVRGLAPTRSQAQTLIRAGLVRVDGDVVTRPSRPVQDEELRVEGSGAGGEAEWIRKGWVGRGALKLAHALDVFALDPTGRRCLDVGASTGGFTQVLLERGAEQVVALDVGHDQLDPALAQHPRVRELSGVSVRDVAADELGGPADLLVADLSFISLGLVLGQLTRLTTHDADLVLLVKPQFEVGREALGKGGVVRSPRAREQVLARLDHQARDVGLVPRGLVRSPVTGGQGNVEYLWWLRRHAHAGRCRVSEDGMMSCGRGDGPEPGPELLAARRRQLTLEEDG